MCRITRHETSNARCRAADAPAHVRGGPHRADLTAPLHMQGSEDLVDCTVKKEDICDWHDI